MAERFYKEINHWYIYAVVSRRDKLAYVAKSCAKDPVARFYEHTRGEIKWTKDDFGPDGESLDSEFLILESLDCSAPVAYRHIIAWCRYFVEQKFCLLNNPTKAWQCDFLKPETKKIYDAVCAPVSISEVLDREVNYEQLESERTMPDKPKNKNQMTQLNIRVQRNVAESFRDFCEQVHLSQNNALALLLAPENQAKLGLVNAPWEELQYQKELNKQLKIENEKLKKKENEIRRRERNYRKVIAAISNQAIDAIERNHPHNFAERKELYPKLFKVAKRQYDLESYQYPDKNGVAKITLIGLVNGIRRMQANKDILSPAALFVLGETDDGNKVKLRWYPRDDNVGISPRNSLYTCLGAKWLVGFVVASDGATNLVAVVPLELLEEDGNSNLQPKASNEMEQSASLDERIKKTKDREQSNGCI